MSIMSRAELRSLPMLQQPSYPDEAALDRVIDTMEKLPPLVFAGECDDLRSKLAEVAEGRAFLLQGGDCAESFDAVTAQHIKDKLLVQLSMAVVMTYAAQVPVVKVGRIAGQYAKPRSKPTETRDGVTLPSYRGDAINGFDFTQAERVALLQGEGEHFGRIALVPAGGVDGVADVAAVLAQEFIEFVADVDDAAHLRGGVVPGEVGGVGDFGDAIGHQRAAGGVAEGNPAGNIGKLLQHGAMQRQSGGVDGVKVGADGAFVGKRRFDEADAGHVDSCLLGEVAL